MEDSVTDADNDVPAGEAADDAIQPFSDLSDEGHDDVTVMDGKVFLRAARSASSGVEAFPARPVCPESGARDMQAIRLGPEAVLHSYSTVHVSATRAVPYTLGYIDFPSGTRALAQVRADAGALRCDLPVILCADDAGTWWVEPKEGAA